MNVGKRIKALRRQKKLTLNELSRKVGISISFLSDIENGRSNPSLERLKDIAEALDTSVSFLMGEDNPMQKDKISDEELDKKIYELKKEFPNLFETLSRAKGPIPDSVKVQMNDIMRALLRDYLENDNNMKPKNGKSI